MKPCRFSLGLIVCLVRAVLLASLLAAPALNAAPPIATGSVIFIHPDGSSVAMWGALRLLEKGPDGNLNWDKMATLGVYRGHLRDSAVSSSNGGATAHAYGLKADYRAYGVDPQKPQKSLSGKTSSILLEARAAGLGTALINSGHLCEPGTGVFAASAPSRRKRDLIAQRIVHSGVDILLAGGEIYLLPQDVTGHHGKKGKRADGRNLIMEAISLGYTVVYTKAELEALHPGTTKVLGVFAAKHTFNDETEETLSQKELSVFAPDAPSVADMTAVALRLLSAANRPFMMVVEEEGSDNLANQNNATGTLKALRRADLAIGVTQSYIKNHPNTLLITTADSDAGGMQVVPVGDPAQYDQPLPPTTKNGAPLDGIQGTATPPFTAAADKNGRQHRFAIAWAGTNDMAGGIVAKAQGLNAHLLPHNVDNTDIYRIMYATLFGRSLPR